jgi:hypothetical protein
MSTKEIPFRVKWQTESEAKAEQQRWWVVRTPVRRETEGPHGTLCVCGVAHARLPAHPPKVLKALIHEREKRRKDGMDVMA